MGAATSAVHAHAASHSSSKSSENVFGAMVGRERMHTIADDPKCRRRLDAVQSGEIIARRNVKVVRKREYSRRNISET